MGKAYKLIKAAEEDLIGIFKYTLERWGEDQADRYIDALFNRFDWLAENSKLGVDRKEIKVGYRSYYEGKHVIFYIIRNKVIEIIAILHQSEDLNVLN